MLHHILSTDSASDTVCLSVHVDIQNLYAQFIGNFTVVTVGCSVYLPLFKKDTPSCNMEYLFATEVIVIHLHIALTVSPFMPSAFFATCRLL